MRKPITWEKSNLVLPDGRQADSLRLLALYRELERLNVPGLKPSMGKHDMLGAYEAAVLARAEAARRDIGHSKTISDHEMRLAAQAMQP